MCYFQGMQRDLSHPIVTGGAGFIGSALCRLLLEDARVQTLTVLDKLTYAGSLENLPRDRRLHFLQVDIADRDDLWAALNATTGSFLFNLAAESHVDRSIASPADFISSNITGTANLLELCRELGIPMLQVSTDEVYGSIPAPGLFTEQSPIAPSSPYSASKASADLLCHAAHLTYGQDITITRCSNNYGAHQFPEKLIPIMVRAALSDQPLPIYGSGTQVRDWIHCDDHCSALIATAEHGRAGEVYNIGANTERTNLEIVHEILAILDKPHSLITHVSDRPAHDQRYAIDSTKALEELGWKPVKAFSDSFPAVVREIASLA